MVCYAVLKGSKKGRWFVMLYWKEGRKEDGLLFCIERKEERKMVCYYELKESKIGR